jgi:hypothetical protein
MILYESRFLFELSRFVLSVTLVYVQTFVYAVQIVIEFLFNCICWNMVCTVGTSIISSVAD